MNFVSSHDAKWKVRTVKDYEGAHNHILVGQVMLCNNVFVQLRCLSFHFGKVVNEAKDIVQGTWEHRIVPWARIELINVLDPDFPTYDGKLFETDAGEWRFGSHQFSCCIAKRKPVY